MYIARRPFVFSCFLPALLAAGAVRAQAPDPAALQAAIAGARLDPSRAVTLKNVKLGVGLGKLSLDDGVLIPATAVGGKTIEMVFLGKGRIEVEPPDAIEAGQLELFTGGSRLDEEFKEAVLVVGQDAAVSAVLRRPAAAPDAELTRRAEALYADWRKKGEWKYMSVERGMLLNALHDPVAAGYFAAWFRGGELGDIFYCVQPGEREQVTVGHFIPIEATDKEKRKLVKQISREQRKGRLLGVEVDDLGQWDTWLSASLRTAGGKPAPGAPTYEPKKYTLDVNLTERDLRLTGKARIDLEPVIAGSRAVSLTLPSDFQVAKVTDPGGAPLFYLRKGGELTVILPQAPPSGGMASVVVEYSGRPVDKDWNLFTLLDTMGWYPHAGSIDRAPYDVTFHWPKGLELVSSGHRMDGGESPDGTRWERRTLDYPAFGFSFEVGRFRVETAQAGHVAVRFAFGNGSGWTGRGVREEVMKAVTDSLQFYEEKFGPYPARRADGDHRQPQLLAGDAGLRHPGERRDERPGGLEPVLRRRGPPAGHRARGRPPVVGGPGRLDELPGPVDQRGDGGLRRAPLRQGAPGRQVLRGRPHLGVAERAHRQPAGRPFARIDRSRGARRAALLQPLGRRL